MRIKSPVVNYYHLSTPHDYYLPTITIKKKRIMKSTLNWMQSESNQKFKMASNEHFCKAVLATYGPRAKCGSPAIFVQPLSNFYRAYL